MPYIKISDSIAGFEEPETAVDFTALIEDIKWSENDLDSPNAGRTLDGRMHRGKVTSKWRADIKLLPAKASEIAPIFQILRNQYFYCSTDLLLMEEPYIMQMYNATRSGGIQIVDTDNVVKHKDVAFNIIER